MYIHINMLYRYLDSVQVQLFEAEWNISFSSKYYKKNFVQCSNNK